MPGLQVAVSSRMCRVESKWRWTVMLLVSALVAVAQPDACPAPELIAPCTCKMTTVECRSSSPNELTRVFDAIGNHPRGNEMISLHLNNYSHPYIPSGIFSKSSLSSLTIRTSHLKSFHDATSNKSSFLGVETSLKSLNLKYETRSCDDFDWSSLSPLKGIYSIHLLGSFTAVRTPFPHLPSVRIFFLEKTDVRYMMQKAFAGLQDVEEMRITRNQVRPLSRNMFPNPANKLRTFIVEDDLMTVLPEDLFDQMPSLEYLHLPSFAHNIPPMMNNRTTNLQGTRGLTCDSRLRWLLRMRDQGSVNILHAICARPKDLWWRDVKTLGLEEL